MVASVRLGGALATVVENQLTITVKMGALMGTGVGLTIGFIFGSFSILRGGPGPRGALATLSQYMLSSAATFGFFMSIGSVSLRANLRPIGRR